MNNRRLRRATIRRPAASAQANSTGRSLLRADGGTPLTHITEPRVISNHAEMGGSTPAPSRIPSTVKDILHTGVRRRARRREMGRARRREMAAAQSTWDSEGGAHAGRESLPPGTEGLPLAPTPGPSIS
jgi:hypothetical protein